MIKRSTINAILKKQGMSNIRNANDKVIRIDGKMLRGIPAGSHSPMDATGIRAQYALDKFDSVVKTLKFELDAKVEEISRDLVLVKIDKQSLYLRLDRYPSYPMRDGMDSGYTQSVITADYC